MKKLYLFRHAKSSWTFDLPDHDRPLGKRGRKDVFKMGEFLKKKITPPEVIISSPASRAFYTALHICDCLGVHEGVIILTEELFHAGSSEILRVIQNAPDCETLAIFGHNPGFTSGTNRLSNANIENIPTGGVAGISFDVCKWSEVEFGKGKEEFFYYPKGI
ncbi:MAG: histidine phosphatase family protein [Ekhidna sp.]|nr:histidine phosphatase family protein [Ekhidna sp.]MBC6427535.1 histidine phosphatase family protein [Ekhidna sp.]